MSGILRLESLTKGNTLKQGDKTPLKYRLFDADGEQLDIAGKSAKVRLVYPDFLTIGYEKEGLTVAQDDTVTFTIDTIIPSRIYHVEIIVDDKFIFPSRADESKFTVDKSSLGTETNIIEIVGVDAVVRKAVDLINADPNLIIDEDKLVGDIISNTGIGSIEEYYQQFNDVITDLSEEKDYHSLPEISAARGGHDTLGDRLDETTAQLAQTEIKLDNRIDNIIATPTTVSEQEIIDARDGESSLGANLRNKAENVVLKNQIRNGDFSKPVDFETDWSTGASDGRLITSVTSEGQLSVESNTPTGASDLKNYLHSKNLVLRSGDKYYLKYDILENINGTLVRIQCFGADGTLLSPSLEHEKSIGTHSMTGVALENTAFAQLNFSLVKSGRKLVIDNIMFFNLTSVFGAGNEPTLAEVEEFINNYPEGYIEDGITLWDMRDTKQAIEEIKQQLNSVENPSAEKLGDISKAERYSSNHEIQDIDDYYRHVNNGSFSQLNFFRQTGLDNIIAGKVYLIDVTARSSPLDMRFGFGNSSDNSVVLRQSSEFTRVRRLIAPTQAYANFGGYMGLGPGGVVGHYIDIKKDAGFYDLTEFFGEGSEPTQAEFDEVVNLYPDADTETLLLKLLTEGNSLLHDELKKTQVAFNNHKDRNKIDFNEMRADFAGMLNPVENTGYYYRGKPAPEVLVGNKALSYESFIANTWELLREENPEYITRNIIIKDTSGELDIYEYVFEPENYTKTVFLISGVHGDEYEAFWGLYYFMKKIAENTDSHERMVGLKDNIRYVIIPICNPWGMERQTRRNSRGVDPNQNYDVNFREAGHASGGSAPFSENESTAVKMIAEKYNSELDLFIDFHTDPYSPNKGNYITIVESSILWDTGEQITLDEIDYLRDTYGFTTVQRPAIVNVSTGNGAWRYMELIKNVPSLIWETSIGLIAKTGTSKMMTIGTDWIINVFTEMLKVE